MQEKQTDRDRLTKTM